MYTGYMPDPHRKDWKEIHSEANGIPLDRVRGALLLSARPARHSSDEGGGTRGVTRPHP